MSRWPKAKRLSTNSIHGERFCSTTSRTSTTTWLMQSRSSSISLTLRNWPTSTLSTKSRNRSSDGCSTTSPRMPLPSYTSATYTCGTQCQTSITPSARSYRRKDWLTTAWWNVRLLYAKSFFRATAMYPSSVSMCSTKQIRYCSSSYAKTATSASIGIMMTCTIKPIPHSKQVCSSTRTSDVSETVSSIALRSIKVSERRKTSNS